MPVRFTKEEYLALREANTNMALIIEKLQNVEDERLVLQEDYKKLKKKNKKVKKQLGKSYSKIYDLENEPLEKNYEVSDVIDYVEGSDNYIIIHSETLNETIELEKLREDFYIKHNHNKKTY